jgi:integrase
MPAHRWPSNVSLPSARGDEVAWKWPIDVERYDRRVRLDGRERRVLNRYTAAYATYRYAKTMDFGGALDRLTLPLTHALDKVGLRPPKQRYVLHYLVREVHRHGRAYWGWTDAEWIDTMAHAPMERQSIAGVAYLLCGFSSVSTMSHTHIVYAVLARKVFGADRIDAVISRIGAALDTYGYVKTGSRQAIYRVVCEQLLANRSPVMEEITLDRLCDLAAQRHPSVAKRGLVAVSRGLTTMGIVREPLPVEKPHATKLLQPSLTANVPSEWARLARHWLETSTGSADGRRSVYYLLLAIGRWLAKKHPDVTSPAQWTRDLAARCTAMVCEMKSGDWAEAPRDQIKNFGQLLAPSTRARLLSGLRGFFRDLQEWDQIPRRFDPYQSFNPPKALMAAIRPDPRTISDDVWAKLVWAGLNFVAADLPTVGGHGFLGSHNPCYPFEMTRALVVTWLFAGLRMNEIRRLRVGCIRWDSGCTAPGDADDTNRVCFLRVPINKTGPAFVKPVDRAVGDAIAAWERVRPPQVKCADVRTGEMVDFLFMVRLTPVGASYLNDVLIPMLCRKAGVPRADLRGNITSHRARSTIASQLFNAKEPMSLFELQQWLGHSTPASTQHYARLTPTKLAKSYADAGYFGRNLRAIEVLIDRDVVQRGKAEHEPWKFYDLGHGYCTYDFFEQCPHRMACAKCDFYLPKASSKASLLEGQRNLLRLRQEIPLQDVERGAVEDGVAAYEVLLAKLEDVPTPSGSTPRDLARKQG